MNAPTFRAASAPSPWRKFLQPPWRLPLAERKRLLYRQAWIALVGGYVAVIFAWLWPADFRNAQHWYVGLAWLAFIGRVFLFQAGCVVLISTMLAAAARRWRLVAASVPLLGLTLGPYLLDCMPKRHVVASAEPFTVMTVNLLMVNRTTEPIIREIEAADPDVLLLQEYTDTWHAAMSPRLAGRWPYYAGVTSDDSFGCALYSRLPFAEPPSLDVALGQATDPQMRVVVDLGDQVVALYNVHLRPPWGLEYVIEHRTQFSDLADILAAELLPVVLAGDFNFTETSPQAATLQRLGFRDSYSIAGWGRGTTWPNGRFFRWVPGIRLDHVFLSRELTCSTCRIGAGSGSDHRPLTAGVALDRWY